MAKATATETPTELIALGAYTPSQGRADGIGLSSFEPARIGRALGTIAHCDSPSFLASHPTLPIICAVHEFEQTVRARVRTSERGQLRALGDAVAAGAAVVQRAPVLAAGRAEGDAAAEISLNTAATRLYVTVRGSNLIAALEVAGDGQIVKALDARSCGGAGPRHHRHACSTYRHWTQPNDTVAASGSISGGPHRDFLRSAGGAHRCPLPTTGEAGAPRQNRERTLWAADIRAANRRLSRFAPKP